MKIVAAYLLAALSGNKPDEKAVANVLSSVGIEVDQAQVAKLVAELKDKNLDQVIEAGKTKLSTVAAAAPAAAPAAGGAKDEKKDEKKGKPEEKKKEEPKKKEEKEEEEGDMGFGLFD